MISQTIGGQETPQRTGPGAGQTSGDRSDLMGQVRPQGTGQTSGDKSDLRGHQGQVNPHVKVKHQGTDRTPRDRSNHKGQVRLQGTDQASGATMFDQFC